MRSADGELLTDLFVKLADAHKILDTSVSHSYYCKKGIPYSQALWLSSICSDNGTFEKRCNNLEQWLWEREHVTKMTKVQIIRAWELLEKTNKIAPETSEQKVMFSITYYPAFQNVINKLQEFHLLLAPD